MSNENYIVSNICVANGIKNRAIVYEPRLYSTLAKARKHLKEQFYRILEDDAEIIVDSWYNEYDNEALIEYNNGNIEIWQIDHVNKDEED